MISTFDVSGDDTPQSYSSLLIPILCALGVLSLFIPHLAAAASMAYLERNAGVFAEKITDDYGEMIDIAALLHDYDRTMILAVIIVESEGNTSAISGRGAQGLMQLMPATAKSMGAKNSKDPFQNILAGTKYLKELEDSYGFNSVQEALVAYNMGPTRARRWLSQYDAVEYSYTQKVMHVYRLIVEEQVEKERLAAATEKKVAGIMAFSTTLTPLLAKPRNISLSALPMTLPASRRSEEVVD